MSSRQGGLFDAPPEPEPRAPVNPEACTVCGLRQVHHQKGGPSSDHAFTKPEQR